MKRLAVILLAGMLVGCIHSGVSEKPTEEAASPNIRPLP